VSNYYKNIIRTFVPVLVASVAAYLTKAEKHLTPSELAVALPIASTLYYAIVRNLEVKFPKLSWLLGALPVEAAPKK
jgi:hypothetical protein